MTGIASNSLGNQTVLDVALLTQQRLLAEVVVQMGGDRRNALLELSHAFARPLATIYAFARFGHDEILPADALRQLADELELAGSLARQSIKGEG